MNFKDEDLTKIIKLTSQQIDHVTCVECCKYYIAPETVSCGHTLCHTCWRERLTCPHCAMPIERDTLKLNNPMKNLTQNVHILSNAVEKLFKVKIAEVLLEVAPEIDPTKNVKDWLASSQNHFSAPAQSSERSSQDMAEIPNPLNVSSNKIQIHSNTSNVKKSTKVVCVPTVPQDDWDKIEPMPDTEVNNRKDKENVIGPMDIEPFFIEDDNEYTAHNPRRSSRKRELKPNEKININDKLPEKANSKGSSEDIDKKSNIAKQNWSNVKRMRKEFSKLNKKNRNKLNVSIEMCKKTQSSVKTFDAVPQALSSHYDIDENTPNNNLHTKKISKENNINVENEIADAFSTSNTKIDANNENKMLTTEVSKQGLINCQKNNESQGTSHSLKDEVTNPHSITKNTVKMPFYKKSALDPNHIVANTSKTVNHTVITNPAVNDDIEITIKVGNTITNIYIKKKNDMELKINTDREIQTSHNINEESNSSKNSQSQNIVINAGDNHDIDIKKHTIANPRLDELKKIGNSDKSVSIKKNTDSAETASAQFEITESVEKELSKVMDFEDIGQPVKSKTTSVVDYQKSTKTNKSQKTPENADEQEYLNDLDIFGSEPVNEPQIQYLKNTEHASSEILLCTVKTKNKTQKITQKRCRGTSNEDTLPKSKKTKCADDTSVMANVTVQQVGSKHDQSESEPMNYDAIIGTVFANIDADIEETRQSQNIIKNTYTLDEQNIKSQNENRKTHSQGKRNEEVDLPADISSASKAIHCNDQKDSENIFSVGIERADENVDAAPLSSTNKKVPANESMSNMNEFLTPVLSQEVNNDVEMLDDDSDKSVVEETPQKSASFTKVKQKSNGANREANQSQRVEVLKPTISSKKDSSEANMISIVSLTDTSLEVKGDANVTAIKAVDRKPTDTPLTINKFVDQIQYKSTPYAKKSLNFDSENVDDVTLCATNDIVANTTQEREFMLKAFEKTPTIAPVKPQGLRVLGLKHRKFVIAGSCITSEENSNLQKLCAKNKWTYANKYSKDITHLVVGVDEEVRAQRSIKYMCALASSKWIVSYNWVEQSLRSKDIVKEDDYEVLDSTGHPGPMRSRIATKKLFQGITFFCMEPFGVLDVSTLKDMLVSAGGRVVEEARQVRVSDKSSAPALLLAEPENTQEDRFIFLAMELSIVPVNYEWALNCLGSYTLATIQDLLLCPASLLPKVTENWPHELIARDEDEDE